MPYERRDSNSNEESDQSDNHVQSEDDDRSPSPVPSDDDGMDVDEDAEDQEPTPSRQSPTRPTLNTNLKPTPPPSTSAIDPAADKPSVPPSNRASFGSTATPPDEHTRPSAIPYEDVDQDHDPDVLDEDDQHHAPDGDVEADGDEDDDAQPEEPSQPPSPTPLAEPEPEPEPEDEDPDLQPAHRAEALDVLATIELKFALLRECVYVEKMEGLAWEEALVWDGTHPELHHLQNELTKRRDKRLMLASKKRTYEIEALARKRREEEAWCWEGWDITCTELQIEMIAETNRKRRKLERDRRTIERPPGARRVPNAILNPPPAPTLRQIANTFPLPSHLSHLAANKKLFNAKGLGVYPGLDGLSGATAYPDLPTLPPHDIAADLEFLFQHRRLGYGFGMGFGPPMGVPMGVGYNSTASGFGPAAMGFGGPTPNPGFGVNGLGGPVETYPPNPGPGVAPGNNASQIGGPPLALGPLVPPGPPSAPSLNTPNPVVGLGSISGPGIANADGPSFSQPAMGVFQGPPSIGPGPTGYPLGPGSSVLEERESNVLLASWSENVSSRGTENGRSNAIAKCGSESSPRAIGNWRRSARGRCETVTVTVKGSLALTWDPDLLLGVPRLLEAWIGVLGTCGAEKKKIEPRGTNATEREKDLRSNRLSRRQLTVICTNTRTRIPTNCNSTPRSLPINHIQCMQTSPILTNIPNTLNTTILTGNIRTSIPMHHCTTMSGSITTIGTTITSYTTTIRAQVLTELLRFPRALALHQEYKRWRSST
ncbi:Sds3-like-domain-containing protein [Boletus reticuloceps]|uniref:Sds3-like-domain-containing protein n=1 Tax=Boletus reticuloceps TaxID=495285 RepID=A0A8I3AF99_9AGAM|nr:Sds3-like-domain-containing protein [Boletus reticuloceps]